MSYIVGQKVRVKENLKPGEFYMETGFLEIMKKFRGQVVTIKQVIQQSEDIIFYKIVEDVNNFRWSHDMLDYLDTPITYELRFPDLDTQAILEKEISKGDAVMFKEEVADTPLVKEVIRAKPSIIPIPKHRKALVMFSGGFDSVALAVKVIESGDYEEVTLLYEEVTVFDDHKQLAHGIFLELVKRYRDKKILILFETVDLDLDWATNPGQDHLYGERDLCLMIHLTTIFGKGQYGSIYLGWNRANIVELPYSNNLLAFLEKFRNSSSYIYFLEDKFLNEGYENERDMTWKAGETKRKVVKLLLERKLFSMCSADGHPTPDKHWYDNSPKWKEVVEAIIDLDFTAKELSTIFKYKTLETVQRIWDKKNITKHVRVTNKVEIVEERDKWEEQVVVEE